MTNENEHSITIEISEKERFTITIPSILKRAEVSFLLSRLEMVNKLMGKDELLADTRIPNQAPPGYGQISKAVSKLYTSVSPQRTQSKIRTSLFLQQPEHRAIAVEYVHAYYASQTPEERLIALSELDKKYTLEMANKSGSYQSLIISEVRKAHSLSRPFAGVAT